MLVYRSNVLSKRRLFSARPVGLDLCVRFTLFNSLVMEDKLLNEELSRSNGPRRWPVKLFECCDYRDIKVMNSFFCSSSTIKSLNPLFQYYREIGDGVQIFALKLSAGKHNIYFLVVSVLR